MNRNLRMIIPNILLLTHGSIPLFSPIIITQEKIAQDPLESKSNKNNQPSTFIILKILLKKG